MSDSSQGEVCESQFGNGILRLLKTEWEFGTSFFAAVDRMKFFESWTVIWSEKSRRKEFKEYAVLKSPLGVQPSRNFRNGSTGTREREIMAVGGATMFSSS